MQTRETHRWRGATVLTLAAAAVGVTTNAPGALLAAVFGVVFVAAARTFTAPVPELAVERTVSDDDPEPGHDVEVTLTVTNEGAFLPDLRIVDGVPDGLDVVAGSPRLATALRPGKHAELRYTVEARRGEHDFSDVTVYARDVMGAHETELHIQRTTTLAAVPPLARLESFPLRSQTVQRVGRVPTRTGGSGVEFHATREYRSGDPLSRVNWNRLAKSGELSTIQYREERAATVVAVVDSRAVSHVGDADGEDAVEYCVQAAAGVANALLNSGDRVGVTAFGPNWEWVAPSVGRDHRAHLRQSLARDSGFAPSVPERRFLGGIVFRRLRKHLPEDAQVVFCSPLVDEDAAGYVKRLEASGYPVTVISPDVTDDDTFGQELARVERGARIRSLRAGGVRVIDWTPSDILALAVARAEQGWSV